jgi:hypothetical protein
MTFTEKPSEDGSFLSDHRFTCAECHTHMDSCLPVCPQDKERTPQPKDVTLCMYCGAIMMFGEDMQPRLPTLDEMLYLMERPEWEAIESMSKLIKGNQ